MLPRNAKIYISLILVSGFAVLLLAAESWSSPDLKQFVIYLGMAVLASTLKIRIPGVESTITPNFLFVTLAINACRFSEVVAISLVAAIVQTVWASAKRPRLVQVAFSAAALVISAALAYQLPHVLLGGNEWESSAAMVILAGCVYFPVNAALVAVIIGLVSGQPFSQILRNGDVWTFPYFMGGIVFAALVTTATSHLSSWKGALLLIPVVILAHLYFKNRFEQKLAEQPSV